MSVQTYLPINTDIDSAMAVVAGVGASFSAHEKDAPDMTVRVEGGQLLSDAGSVLVVAPQDSPAIVAPTTNPRHDIIYLDPTDGTIGVETGVEASTPSDPSVPNGFLPLARVRLSVNVTVILNVDIDDCRIFPPPGDFFRRLKSDEKTASHAVARRDAGKMLIANSASPITFTLSAISTLRSGFVVWVKNVGAGALTVVGTGGETIDGAANLTVGQGEATMVWADGTNWRSLGFGVASGGSGSGTGSILQTVFVHEGAHLVKTGTIAYDNTIPQQTEGAEFITATITPASTNNKLLIEGNLRLAASNSPETITAALFRDSVADALTAASVYESSSGSHPVQMQWYMDAPVAGSPVVFKLRAGGHSSANIALNGDHINPYLTGVSNSFLRVTEIKG